MRASYSPPPRELRGGSEAGLRAQVDTALIVASADPAAGWVQMVSNAHVWMVGNFASECQDEVFGGRPDVRVPGTLAAQGTTRPAITLSLTSTRTLGCTAGSPSDSTPGPHLSDPEFSLRPVLASEAAAMSSWRYEPPFDWYDPGDPELYLHFDQQAFEGYLALVDENGTAVGFVCLGVEARVAGQQLDDDVVDVGIGIDPTMTSTGVATRAMPVVVQSLGGGRRLRAAIWAKNVRAIATARRAGFVPARYFDGPAGRPFVEMVTGNTRTD